MRIIQTINDTIRLLFNPKTEVFCLSDFLLVRDSQENFLAQVVEVYDDKFDQEANVAKIKLIFRIVNGNELVPYDNYTPSRECEVAKIKQSEIETCINLNKKTIIAGKSAINGDPVEINTNFFENNCVIFADKYEQTNKITECLAPSLSKYKNVLILDFSGTCNLDGASRFTSGADFKMPLSADTIDYIQQKTLLRAKLETQVVLGEIFEEVKSFLEASEDGYIPFSKFIQVIQAECKKEPSVELLVLISWLRKYSRQGLFARTKKEFAPFFNSLIKNKITTLDVSNIKTEWQKEFVEFVINNIRNDVFVLVRLNDNNVNNDIINTIYLKKKNISFIPSFAYGYKKASYVLEFAQNYILLPTLNPKRDFNHANFQIQSLNNESFMLFGEDTKDFIFVLEFKSPIKKVIKSSGGEENADSDKLFISLNLQLDDMTPIELTDNFELKTIEKNNRRSQEEIKLSDVLLSEKKAEIEEKEEDEPVIVDEPEENIEPVEDTALVSMAEVDVLGEDELDYFDSALDEEALQEDFTEDETNEALNVVSENEEKEDIEDIEEVEDETIQLEQEIEEQAEKEKQADLPKIKEPPKKEEEKETVKEDNLIVDTDKKNELLRLAKENEEDEEENAPEIDDNVLDAIDEVNGIEIEEEPTVEETSIEEIVEEKIKSAKEKEEPQEEEIEIVEPEDDRKAQIKEALEIKKEAEAKKEEKLTEDEIEVNKKFDEILSDESNDEAQKEQLLKVDEKNSIDLEKIKEEIKNPQQKLPVFDEDNEGENNLPASFKEGDNISHEQYGKGQILKVIKYGARCLLQIEFPEVGKRLLDPKIAKLTIVEE